MQDKSSDRSIVPAKSSVKIEEINVMQPKDVDDNYILTASSNAS